MKKTYLTLIQIVGLRRADATRARAPIGEGEVIALPDGFARTLLDSGSIEPTDAEETVELFWDQPVELIKSNDPEGLKNALEVLGIDFASGPDQSAVNVIGIAPTDVQALAQALEAQGALVLLPGEQIAGTDHARLAQLMQERGDDVIGVVHTPKLLAELAKRIGDGEIELSQLPEEFLGLAAPAFAKAIPAETVPGDAEPKDAATATAGPTDAKPAKSPRKRD